MPENGNHIPRFERELMNAGGDLSALAERKKAEDGENAEAVQEPEESVPNEQEDIDFVYGDDGYDSSRPLEEIAAENIVLDDMASSLKLEEMRTTKSALATSLKHQMIADDLAMEVGTDARLEEMSTEYGKDNLKQEDILSKDYLDRNERDVLKTRMQEQLSAKPKGYNQKKSMEMAKKLMAEQKDKEAKKGFFMLLAVAAIAGLSAVIMYFLDLNADGSKPYASYIMVAAVIFALMMIMRSGFGRILSAIYFFLQTAFLLGPGLFFYVISPDAQASEDYIIKIVMFVAAVFCSAFPAVKILTGKKIGVYYSHRK